ncbi:MAG: hypothetical protein ACE5QF_08260 [Thermoplasmata archaeon]
MAEACLKCGNGRKTCVRVSLFTPYRPKGVGVEQRWPLRMVVCENCGYAESYVEKSDIPSLRSLSRKQDRLSKTRVESLK